MMNAIDPNGVPLLELMLDFYDHLQARSPGDRDAAFKKSCYDLTLAIVTLRRLSPDCCADWMIAIGERFQVANARSTVQQIMLRHSEADGEVLH